MTLQDLKTALDGIENVARIYGYFPENQEAPYIAYYSTNDNQIFADGQLVYSEETVTMLFVSRHRDLETESYIDGMLTQNGVQFSKEYDLDPEQKIHTVTYNFTAITT